MKFRILTLFPEMFDSPLKSSLIGKAQERGIIGIEVANVRDYAQDKHKQVDDYPFGGGPGMVIRADVALRALEDARRELPDARTILLSPGGRMLSQELAGELAAAKSLVLFCGHYEGVDNRILAAVDEEVSIGDYVLTGGELAALVVIDVVARLIPGVLGSEESVSDESFTDGLLEYPQFTRPRKIDEMEVPPVLVSGNHEEIRRWRKKESIRKTLTARPDLLINKELNDEEKKFLLDIILAGREGEE
ncbi:MAG: tRNA (guanosine(37)-N1)-methyltransferase TrmD [Syntrophomonadaceae bacterium]|nr:tRNA (guanosine(37)-N1)-methyltransferase TrmD [Syntrophomonadaceae bacterium]